MKAKFLQLFSRMALIGADDRDDEETKLQKSLLVICAFPFMFAGWAWGTMYFLFGEVTAGLIPFCYGIFSLFSISYFAINRQFAIFRFSQLFLILILPTALMFALGGFVYGSAVILWGLICPLGALLFDKPKNAPLWFLAYILLIIVSGILDPYIAFPNNLTKAQRNFFFIINFSGVSSLIFLMVFYFVQKKNFFQERSETLLLNILPKEIADILRQEIRPIANHFDNATILFADVVNFTPLSATMTPAALVDLLNEVFSKFDALAEKYGLEKIKTIGDCYMVAAGVPRSRADHALALTAMAVEMRDYIETHTFQNIKLQFRFGINSGPVVAGVIGRKKFIYDLWGDAVNIASRMEAQGNKNTIQITQATHDLIKNHFDCHFNGTVDIKGKGAMNVWHVLSKVN